MKRSDLEQLHLVKDGVWVRVKQSPHVGELFVDVYKDPKSGRYVQAQSPLQGNLYRVTAGLGETSEYSDWSQLED